MQLRQIASDYMKDHLDEFLPYLTDENGELLLDRDRAIDYLNALVDNSRNETNDHKKVIWGGHAEIVALSKAFHHPIYVYSAAGLMKFGENEDNLNPNASAPLQISFHHHYYGLGDHYNSIVKEFDN
jgi:OTU domain-containing protein 6